MDKTPSPLRELAHELRDALSPIRSAIDLIRLRAFDPEASEKLLQRIERGLSGALATLDAFVVAEQFTEGGVSLAPAPVPLAQLLRQTQDGLSAALRARCEFTAPDAAVQVMADTVRSTQALASMLEKAAAVAAPQTPVTLHALIAPDGVRVQVRFTSGTRIADSARWFETYRACGSSRTALRTARRILQQQHGDLRLEEGPAAQELVAVFMPAAQGETAALSAPQPSAPAAATAAGEPALRGKRLLIVDDSAEVRRAYREGLAALGYEVNDVPDGEAALRQLDTARPDAALIDINLPGMNGYQLARKLRQRAGTALRLVMLSGMTLDEVTLRESQNAGFDRCFDKAAGPKALHALLGEVL